MSTAHVAMGVLGIASLPPISASSTHLPSQRGVGTLSAWENSRSLTIDRFWRNVKVKTSSAVRTSWPSSLRARAPASSGSAAFIAKEMERVAAKEALLLAASYRDSNNATLLPPNEPLCDLSDVSRECLYMHTSQEVVLADTVLDPYADDIKDAGGLKGLAEASVNDKAKIDVNEKIVYLERLNPTPRPTTSPVLEGLWQFEWAGARSPGIVAARTFLGRFPPAVASINSLTLLILDGSAKATGILKVFNTVESNFTLVTKLTVEGPVRVKEEYVEGLFALPRVPEESIPSQLKGVVDQLIGTVERLPDAVKDVVSSGIKLPLTGTFSRELIISYLDEEVMVARDKSGSPDVLLRIEAPATDISTNTAIIPEYLS